MSASVFLRHCALGNVYSGLEYNVFIPTLCIMYVILIYLLNFKQNKHWKLLCFLQNICLFEVTRIVTLHILNTHISVSKNCHNNLSSDNLLYVLYFCYVKKKAPTNFFELLFG